MNKSNIYFAAYLQEISRLPYLNQKLVDAHRRELFGEEVVAPLIYLSEPQTFISKVKDTGNKNSRAIRNCGDSFLNLKIGDQPAEVRDKLGILAEHTSSSLNEVIPDYLNSLGFPNVYLDDVLHLSDHYQSNIWPNLHPGKVQNGYRQDFRGWLSEIAFNRITEGFFDWNNDDWANSFDPVDFSKTEGIHTLNVGVTNQNFFHNMCYSSSKPVNKKFVVHMSHIEYRHFFIFNVAKSEFFSHFLGNVEDGLLSRYQFENPVFYSNFRSQIDVENFGQRLKDFNERMIFLQMCKHMEPPEAFIERDFLEDLLTVPFTYAP